MSSTECTTKATTTRPLGAGRTSMSAQPPVSNREDGLCRAAFSVGRPRAIHRARDLGEARAVYPSPGIPFTRGSPEAWTTAIYGPAGGQSKELNAQSSSRDPSASAPFCDLMKAT